MAKKKGRSKKEPIIIIKGEEAIMEDKQGRHIKNRYDVTRQDVEDGNILLKLTPKTAKESQRKKLIEELSEKLKDSIDNKALMQDVLTDINLESLEKLDKALKRGAVVKPKEGCFYLQIRDPKRKKPMKLQIRS